MTIGQARWKAGEFEAANQLRLKETEGGRFVELGATDRQVEIARELIGGTPEDTARAVAAFFHALPGGMRAKGYEAIVKAAGR